MHWLWETLEIVIGCNELILSYFHSSSTSTPHHSSCSHRLKCSSLRTQNTRTLYKNYYNFNCLMFIMLILNLLLISTISMTSLLPSSSSSSSSSSLFISNNNPYKYHSHPNYYYQSSNYHHRLRGSSGRGYPLRTFLPSPLNGSSLSSPSSSLPSSSYHSSSWTSNSGSSSGLSSGSGLSVSGPPTKVHGSINCMLAIHSEITWCNQTYHQSLTHVIVKGYRKESRVYRQKFCCGHWNRERCIFNAAQRKCDQETYEKIKEDPGSIAVVDSRFGMNCDDYEHNAPICSAARIAIMTNNINLWLILISTTTIHLTITFQC